jgi:signal transduction histidine kinase
MGTHDAANAAPNRRTKPSHVVFWRSLYWRIGVSLVLFMLSLAGAQTLLLSYRMRVQAADIRRSPNIIAMDVALTVAAALEAGEDVHLDAVRARYPGRSGIYVVTTDGRVRGTSDTPLSPTILAGAQRVLGMTPADADAARWTEGPVVIAPIQSGGRLQGLVVMPPPPRSPLTDALGLITLPGLLLLAGVTAVAAFLIVTPARRKLAALEAAAARMGAGDLTARAPVHGGDEIARVAAAFNRMGDELGARDEALRRVDALRRQMLADVSHELRTPLTTNRGFIETLQMPPTASSPDRSRYLATIEREIVRLERIVADLLDVARLEAGVADFDVRVFDTGRLFGHVAHRHERTARDAGVRLAFEVEAGADQMTGDPHRLEQAMENLVANALRYTPRGGDVVMRAAAGPGMVRLSVSDTGPGIPADHLDRVFDRFYKADPSRAAALRGSGLGLSIVKAIAERHGGRVAVASQPGRTVFSIELPREALT